MFGLATKSAAKATAIPRHLTTLSVSWLNGQFRAVSVHRGEVEASWQAPEACDNPEQIEFVIQQAVRETGYQGQTVSLILAHPRLVYQMVDTPPVKGTTLEKFLKRQAQQQKIFTGEAAYASQPLVAYKAGSPRALLHLFPRLVLNQLMLACKRNDLHLVSVVPASAVLQHQLGQLGLQKDEVAMLAGETGGATTVVIGTGDRRLLLARTLQSNWTTDPARLSLDLNRTLLYASQQFNTPINKVFLFGPDAAPHCETVQRQMQAQVKPSPVAFQPQYWGTDSLKLAPEAAPNFLSPELQKAPQRRLFAKVVAASALVLFLGTAALTSYSLVQSYREQQAIRGFTRQIAVLEERELELSRMDAELKRKQQAIDLVLKDRPQPKPAWLLAYLGQVVPPDLVVTNFVIRREDDFYRVKLQGTFQQTVKTPVAAPIADSVQALKTRLAGSPFFMRVLEDAYPTNAAIAAVQPAKPATARVPLTEWLTRVTTTVAAKAAEPAPREEMDHFTIEATLK